MLQNAYFLAKIGADTAENEQHFAEILPTDALCLSAGWTPSWSLEAAVRGLLSEQAEEGRVSREAGTHFGLHPLLARPLKNSVNAD